MWTCRKCEEGHTEDEKICICGYDPSKDYEAYRVLAPLSKNEIESYEKHNMNSFALKYKQWVNEVYTKLCTMDSEKAETILSKLEKTYFECLNMKEKRNLLMADEEFDSIYVLGSKYLRKDIKEIVFLNTLEEKSRNRWDVSADGSGEVLAWIEDGILTIAAEGKIKASSCKCLFQNYFQVKKIRFNDCLDTKGIKDMSHMFRACQELEDIDLDGLNTSNVTDMSYMFCHCNNVKELDVSGFDTSKVVDMRSMFSCCYKIDRLDVSGFNTAKVCNMNSMFTNCYNVKELDVSGFDTSKVTDMGNMFSFCYSVKALDVSRFDTSNVTNKNAMLRGVYTGSA